MRTCQIGALNGLHSLGMGATNLNSNTRVSSSCMSRVLVHELRSI